MENAAIHRFDLNPSICIALVLLAAASVGCTRMQYRLQADSDAYRAIAERNHDSRWSVDSFTIDQDPRSRYFDGYDPDCPPMPEDDPASHRYMHCVDGKKGWPCWHANGDRFELENPNWYELLSEYVQTDDSGAVRLDIDSALKLAYMHSPLHQRQLETLYLSSLDVSGERFRLDTQFFGGYGTNYEHNGSLAQASLSYDSTSGKYVVTPPVDVDGFDTNRLTIGRPSAAAPVLQANRRFATAGQLLVGFANSFVFEFTGGNANLTSSLANFTFIQPLLRGAGRDIALQDLTDAERTLLGNLRAYGQFRQGFYTQLTVGEVGVDGPQRNGSDTSLTVFSGQGSLGGYLGLLQQLQRIRNTRDNLSLQVRTLAQLEFLLEAGHIELVQVDQFRQSVENERANLLLNQNNFERSLDTYKTATLGLPPDLEVDLDAQLIEQFQLIDPKATTVQDRITGMQDVIGNLPNDVTFEALQPTVDGIADLIPLVRERLNETKHDVDQLQVVSKIRTRRMDAEQRDAFSAVRSLLDGGLVDQQQQFQDVQNRITSVQNMLATNTQTPDRPEQTVTQCVVILRQLLRLIQENTLVQARARLESIDIEPTELDSREAFDIALTNRLDFMNGRAALVDRWRDIQVTSDALQSVLNITGGGDLRTARNNPASFRAPTGSLQVGVEFDAPLTRLLERNAYRESLIEYQRSRRALIQSHDSLHLGLRNLLRQIQLLETNLEIQRRAVAIAIRRVDSTRAELYAPSEARIDNQAAAQFGPTSTINMLSALSSLRDTQNNFLGVWLNHYAARIRLARELGTMKLDPNGNCIPNSVGTNSEPPSQSSGTDSPEPPPLPPAIPTNLLQLVEE